MPVRQLDKRVQELPAYQVVDSLNTALQSSPAVVVTAPPGAGKSTLLPLTIKSETKGKVIVIEPRRLAARQVAERLAYNIGDDVGRYVGYAVRFDSNVSADTQVEVVTEGVMLRRLMTDNMLDDVDVVVFDEFHERSISSDVILALVREIQQLLRPELRIVIMSATIDTEAICRTLDAPLIECRGRMYDVSTVLVPRERDTTDTESISRDVCTVIRRSLHDSQGDVLVFLPGQGEIMRCADILSDLPADIMVCPLYGLLSPQKQREAIAPAPSGYRKIVLATSIAETSLTIEGVRVVVDSGYCRHVVTDQRTGLTHLETIRISRDMADQRRGRAGRVAEGVCYQMWNSAISLTMKPNRQPEVLDADLASTVLSIVTWGESNVEALPWLTPPPHANVMKAMQMLRSLNALSDSFSLTSVGRSMAMMPCHPRISKMLLSARGDYQKALAADIAALVEESDPLSQTANDADINTRIAVLRQMRQRGSLGRWSNIERVANQYRHIIKVKQDNEMPDRNDTGYLLSCAFPERVGKQLHNGQYRLSGGDNAVVDVSDQLSAYDWIVVASMNDSTGRVFLASPVDAGKLETYEFNNVSWNSKQGCVLCQKEWRIGKLVVKTRPVHDVPREEIHNIISLTAKKEGLSMFDFNDDVKLLQRRIMTVSEWHPEMNLPDVSTEAILQRAGEWVPMYAGKSTTVDELKKIDMCEVIWSLMDYSLRQQVERLAPTHIQMPNGHRIRIDYRQGAEAPVLSVRLQECFGMMETPRLDDGRKPVLMELLSPGFKPVQLTQDLRSFWDNTYFDVRKELRRRYPKHSWPENPINPITTK